MCRPINRPFISPLEHVVHEVETPVLSTFEALMSFYDICISGVRGMSPRERENLIRQVLNFLERDLPSFSKDELKNFLSRVHQLLNDSLMHWATSPFTDASLNEMKRVAERLHCHPDHSFKLVSYSLKLLVAICDGSIEHPSEQDKTFCILGFLTGIHTDCSNTELTNEILDLISICPDEHLRGMAIEMIEEKKKAQLQELTSNPQLTDFLASTIGDTESDCSDMDISDIDSESESCTYSE